MRTFLVLMALLGLLAWAAPGKAARPPAWHHTAGCAEDMPCWDCLSMGNRVCGPLHQTRYEVSAWADFGPAHYLLNAPLPSFVDYLWYLDGDCWGC